MKHAVSLALAAALLTCSATTFVHAQQFTDNNVRIVYVSRSDLGSSSGKILPTITRGMQDTAQQELNDTAGLKSHLQKHNVELNNVVKIDTAANGDKIVYVK